MKMSADDRGVLSTFVVASHQLQVMSAEAIEDVLTDTVSWFRAIGHDRDYRQWQVKLSYEQLRQPVEAIFPAQLLEISNLDLLWLIVDREFFRLSIGQPSKYKLVPLRGHPARVTWRGASYHLA